MSSKQEVNVTVLQTGEVYFEPPHPRPVRRLPDGGTGVVYKGVVYPLYPGNYIELDDEPFDTIDCPGAEEPIWPTNSPSEVPFAWHLENNKFGNYLVFDGLEDRCDKILEELENKGFSWIRADTSTRDADDGRRYDWFIRLEDDRSKEAIYQEIEELLIGLPGEDDEPEEELEEEPSVEELEGTTERHAKTLEELKKKQQEVLALKRDKKELDRLLKEKLAEEIPTDPPDEYPRLEELKQENGHLREKAEVLDRAKADLESTVSDKVEHLERRNKRIAELEKKLAQQRPAGRRKDQINQVKGLLNAFFERLEFDDLSFRTICDDYTSYNTLIRHLSNLSSKELSNRKKVKSTKSWWEIAKVPTGSNDHGRIYFRGRTESGIATKVWVRMKETQGKDIKRMHGCD